MKSKEKIPDFFGSLLWSYRFPLLDPGRDARTVIVQTINYGEWRHWQWILRAYGKAAVKKIIKSIPASEFRPAALILAKLIFDIKKMKYASRSAYIRYKKNLAKA